ncbi:MaoC family dehydratase [Caulobacter mirabilis]|uniref:(R)-hydratase n=1 Tax=Caulobacter mirabilis TaxID=69666 RepID=A0A2D2B204_9CAUL|nr:MaoC family dehydratase [Caulobacter mirabilis]ATQ44305.1 (R)-hydratase [Caulobacter mirabilis]
MSGLFLEDLSVGQSAELTRTVAEADVVAFADVSGDHNPVHLDEAFAATTPFKTRIAHGMLSGAYISALIAGKLPGPGAIYLSQNLVFKRPVKLGDEVTVTVTITAIDEAKARVTLATVCTVGGKTVVDGEAVIMASRKAA